MKQIQALRGFRDLYPAEKAKQQYIFEKVREVARQFGFEEYDGPIVEPVSLYANKSSEELVEKQTFQIKPRDEDDQWILRPEMTPTLARMVAAKSKELIFPLRYYNIGPRFRYEAPQKGRSREFWQMDFDILGTTSVLADAEILMIAVSILLKIGFTFEDFEIKFSSRQLLQSQAKKFNLENKMNDLLFLLDRSDKWTNEQLSEEASKRGVTPKILKVLSSDTKIMNEDMLWAQQFFKALNNYGILEYCKPDFSVVRGLDYYTGFVFEIKKKNDKGRSTLIGGGRYDNLITNFNEKAEIPGVGFAVSDIALLTYLAEKNKLPDTSSKPTKILVTVFNTDSVSASIQIVNELRTSGVSAELYPETDKKLDKQLKYADRNNIPYALIIGPEEVENKTYKLKNLKSQEQEALSKEELIKKLT